MQVGQAHITACWFHGNAIGLYNTIACSFIVDRTIVSDSTDASKGGYYSGVTPFLYISNSVFANNAGSGVVWNGFQFNVYNSIFYGNGNYGIDGGAVVLDCDFNAFGANTNGNRHLIPAGPNDVTLTASPFTSSTNFALNTTAGGGAACKASGYPGAFPGGASTGSLDIGAVQSAGGGGGGGGSWTFAA